MEYLVNARDGQAYFYDINALSNFVADAPNVVGFDPIPKLVDYLMMRAGLAESRRLHSVESSGLIVPAAI